MDKQIALKVVIDVATKRAPHPRTTLINAVEVLEMETPATKPKKAAVKK